MAGIDVTAVGDHPTVLYAADELARCLRKATGQVVNVSDRVAGSGGLRVGLGGDLDVELPAVDDVAVDDAIVVRTLGVEGIIAGNNPRSVLLAVYRYLTELGCRWVRPGADGEYIPRVDLAGTSVTLCETPSYRHRAVCIEGAASFQHVRDMIEYLPRVGMNSYFIQFDDPHPFLNWWYSHRNNPLEEGTQLPDAQAEAYKLRFLEEIAKRDLLYHAMGHGWTNAALGVEAHGWDKAAGELPRENLPFAAVLNGERGLNKNMPLTTNLCYSNDEARGRMVRAVVDFAANRPETDLLHVWLADAGNVMCECDACGQKRPADWYMMALNEIDEALTARGLKTRIVFLLYIDLLWPPETQTLNNPDRFVLMFAPITRTYSRSFADVDMDRLPELPPFELNKLTFPAAIEENLSFLRAWQNVFDADGVDFDYHLLYPVGGDFGGMGLAEVIHRDVRCLKDLGLNGYISCQTQRVASPTGLALNALARTLWDCEVDFEDIVSDYFEAAFGSDWSQCRGLLQRLSDSSDMAYYRYETPEIDAEVAERFAQAPSIADELSVLAERNSDAPDPCRSASWRYLRLHMDIARGLARALELKASGRRPEAEQQWASTRELIWRYEPQMHSVLDAYVLTHLMRQLDGSH